MQRYFAIQKKDNNFILENSDNHHIKTVMRMKENDLVEVVFENHLYLCKLVLNEQKLVPHVEKQINEKMQHQSFNLIVPFLKEQKMDFILQKATELGVDNIYLFDFKRSVVKMDIIRLNKKLERWYKICKEASEQSKRLDVPIISYLENYQSLKELIGNKILCSTKDNLDNIRIYLKNMSFCDKINVVIGPEGGITNEEEEILNSIGFVSISLGKQILRVETVPLFVLSVLNYEYME
ncbi:MAG: RsmE family RNA methyltransferase [Bacilli bacterium]|nr:RsmE family RNA methyltransferase [Bacilli bacterium]